MYTGTNLQSAAVQILGPQSKMQPAVFVLKCSRPLIHNLDDPRDVADPPTKPEATRDIHANPVQNVLENLEGGGRNNAHVIIPALHTQ